jgi:3D (Asp-Asp-Asp) domain-containing protein
VRGRTATLAACLLTVLAALSVPLASGAGPSGAAAHADALRRENAGLASRARGAVLDLFALDRRLARAGARLESLRNRSRALVREQAATRRQLAVARRVLALAERDLAGRMRALYEAGDVDPLAVVLGARSLDDAVGSLDALSRTADGDRAVIAQTLAARHRLESLVARLAASRSALVRATAEARGTLGALAGARAAQEAYLGRLARTRRLNAVEISQLERQAAAASVAAARLDATGAAADPPAGAPAGGRTITVLATGYSLTGSTSTGVPAGWGVAAVDPSTIPLGTHMTVPGYGEAVAADTGGGVHGASIDLWFPSQARALAWGRRMISVTLH